MPGTRIFVWTVPVRNAGRRLPRALEPYGAVDDLACDGGQAYVAVLGQSLEDCKGVVLFKLELVQDDALGPSDDDA